MNAYHLRCTHDFEIVTPASRVMLTDMYGTVTETDTVLPEHRFNRRRGESYVARRKAEAESLVRSGNWAWEDCEVNRSAGRSPIYS